MFYYSSYLATIMLSLRDKIHSSAEALLKLTLMGARPYHSARPDRAAARPIARVAMNLVWNS